MQVHPPARWLVPSVIGLAVALAACGPSGATPAVVDVAPSAAAATPGSAGAAGDTAAIADFSFAPGELTVAAGTSVTWTNNGQASHTVTADDSAFDSGTLGSGATFVQAFPTAGTYAYHCAIHSGMTGTVVVTP